MKLLDEVATRKTLKQGKAVKAGGPGSGRRPGFGKAFPTLDDSPGSHHVRMAHAVTEYDRRRVNRPGYNKWALPQYLGAVNRVHQHLQQGGDLAKGIENEFNEPLATHVKKRVGLV